MIEDILKNIHMSVDGRGYAGKIDEFTLPKLTLKTEEHRAGGMDAPAEIEMGMEKLECELTSAGVDKELLKVWGLSAGNLVPLTFRGALESEDGTVKAVTVNVRGKVREIDFGTWKPGEKSPMKAMIACRYFKLEHDGETVHEIDVDNMVRIINGTDQLEAQRAALGL